jgi:hypothetical protein
MPGEPTPREVLLCCLAAWQVHPNVHPLTCGKSSRHPSLAPVIGESETGIVLCCLQCDYTQPLSASLAAIVTNVPPLYAMWSPAVAGPVPGDETP